jgi:hypothetical protein
MPIEKPQESSPEKDLDDINKQLEPTQEGIAKQHADEYENWKKLNQASLKLLADMDNMKKLAHLQEDDSTLQGLKKEYNQIMVLKRESSDRMEQLRSKLTPESKEKYLKV